MRMLTMMSTTALCALLATGAAAQTAPEVKLQPSPMGQAAVQVGGSWSKGAEGGERYAGGKWVVVDYSRPLLRGRKNIFGSGAEYGKFVNAGGPIWRAGANATTTLTTQAPLMIGGKRLEPGVYNVFVDLKPGNWTLVLSNQPRQAKYDPNDKQNLYGAANYDPKFDVARVSMQVEDGAMRHEQFTIAFVNVTDASMTLAMAWEQTVATATIGVAK